MPDVPRRPAIFAYEVPACARDVAYLHHLPAPEQLHLTGMLQQITAIEEHLKQHHLVEQPEDGSWGQEHGQFVCSLLLFDP
ncbi:unnamed protein product [Effrenium voratum]|uniref:Uncharacterized protein n=1 Tax=Effrenium voratum TaxID=2562239 RepID=A0AA36I5E1_9DINO|nr:unnamed protein product [Effrenium voratum]